MNTISEKSIPAITLIILLTTLTARAQSQYGDFYYTNDAASVTITGRATTNQILVIPSAINGLPVTQIANFAFFYATYYGLTQPWPILSVSMPNSITSIGGYVFGGCVALTNIQLSTNLTVIPNGAISQTAITGITIPPGVTNFEPGAFAQCNFLTNIVLPALLSGSLDTTFYGDSNLTSIIIPSGVTNIGNEVFYGCSRLFTAIIPTNIASIGSEAFAESGIKNIVLPVAVTNIGPSAFSGCTNLTNVTILGNCYIGDNAFGGDFQSEVFSPFQSVYIAGGNIGTNAFQNCSQLTTVILGNGVTIIDENAFLGDPISSLFIPSSVAFIGDGAFEGNSLTNVVIGTGLNQIWNYAFFENSHLTNVLFLGNAPAVISFGDFGPFGECPATVYYLPGTTGWSNTFGRAYFAGAPTALWNPVIQTTDGHFGIRGNQFGFNITNGGTTNIPITVLACTNLLNPVWTPLTNVMLTNTYYFSDPQFRNYSSRYYGIGFP